MSKTSVKEMESDTNAEIVYKEESNIVSESNSLTEGIVIEVEKSDKTEIRDVDCEKEIKESISKILFFRIL